MGLDPEDTAIEQLTAEQYQQLIEETSDVITIVDSAGIIQYQSPGSKAVKGWPREELLGERIQDYIHPDDRERVLAEFGALTGEVGRIDDEIEFRFRSKTGEWIWLAVTGAAPGSESTIDGYIVTSRDVTDRKNTEDERQRQIERLEKFTGVVSHDLRNPLNVARGYLEMAQETNNTAYLDEIGDSLDQMERLIDELLELAKAGKTVTELEPVTLATAIEDAWAGTDTTGVSVTSDVDQTINADPDRLQRLLKNLFRNAVEHGGTTVTVGDIDGGFYVEDDGPGIPEDKRTAVFEAGYSTAEEGTGFGLNIVEEIVNAHGWSITVTEGTTGGARFEIQAIDRASPS